MGSLQDTIRRWIGGVFLAASAGMLIVGQTVFSDRLHGKDFIYYWTVCVLFTGLTLFVGLMDMRAVRLRLRREQTKLIEETLQDIMDEEKLQDR